MTAGIFRILFWVFSAVPVFSGSRQNRTVAFVVVLLNGSPRRFFTLVFLDTPLKWGSAFLFSVSFAQFIGAYAYPEGEQLAECAREYHLSLNLILKFEIAS